MDLTEADASNVRTLRPAFQEYAHEFAERFYQHLLHHPHTAEFLRDPQQLEQLEKLQADYFGELLEGVFDTAYFEGRLRVGLGHQRIGLEPAWYLGAYNQYIQLTFPIFARAFGSNLDKVLPLLLSLVKVIFLGPHAKSAHLLCGFAQSPEKYTHNVPRSNGAVGIFTADFFARNASHVASYPACRVQLELQRRNRQPSIQAWAYDLQSVGQSSIPAGLSQKGYWHATASRTANACTLRRSCLVSNYPSLRNGLCDIGIHAHSLVGL